MNRSTGPRLLRLILSGMALALLVMGGFAKRGWRDWKRVALRNGELERQIEGARARKQSLERQVEALQSDRSEQERVVRQVLGYVRSDETVIEF